MARGRTYNKTKLKEIENKYIAGAYEEMDSYVKVNSIKNKVLNEDELHDAITDAIVAGARAFTRRLKPGKDTIEVPNYRRGVSFSLYLRGYIRGYIYRATQKKIDKSHNIVELNEEIEHHLSEKHDFYI